MAFEVHPFNFMLQAEVMRSYATLNQRMAPFWTQVTTMLDDDMNRTETAERNQVTNDLTIVNGIGTTRASFIYPMCGAAFVPVDPWEHI